MDILRPQNTPIDINKEFEKKQLESDEPCKKELACNFLGIQDEYFDYSDFRTKAISIKPKQTQLEIDYYNEFQSLIFEDFRIYSQKEFNKNDYDLNKIRWLEFKKKWNIKNNGRKIK